jgi:hypothetical protein
LGGDLAWCERSDDNSSAEIGGLIPDLGSTTEGMSSATIAIHECRHDGGVCQ